MKFRKSLLAKYLMIICIAVFLFPVLFPVTSLLTYLPIWAVDEIEKKGDYPNGNELEAMWHNEAEKLDGASPSAINQKLRKLKGKYPDSSLFWVKANGDTQLQLGKQYDIPAQWSASYMAHFMKVRRGYDSDPFTVVAFLGGDPDQGFMVFQLPREFLHTPTRNVGTVFMASFVIVLVVFIALSLLFFNRIRKRLLHLKQAMDERSENEIPDVVKIFKKDEIGQLEESFNNMVHQLEESRERELEEEQLRRQLIANLSHDLRTPLTTLRGHAYSLKKENLTDSGKESLVLIDHKINYLGQLIENLLSYTLLSAGKYPYHPVKTSVIPVIRSAVASWYPVFEREGFEIDVNLPEKKFEWTIDVQWLERILDNLFQNILRHAAAGKYVGVKAAESTKGLHLTIEDHGQGLETDSDAKGAGMGLSIVALMVKEMDLSWDIEANENGTKIIIYNSGTFHDSLH